jgi:hypothetical protein
MERTEAEKKNKCKYRIKWKESGRFCSMTYPLYTTRFVLALSVYPLDCAVRTRLDSWFICGDVNMLFSPWISDFRFLTLATKGTQTMESSNWRCYVQEWRRGTCDDPFASCVCLACWAAAAAAVVALLDTQSGVSSVNKSNRCPWGLNYNAITLVCRSASPHRLRTFSRMFSRNLWGLLVIHRTHVSEAQFLDSASGKLAKRPSYSYLSFLGCSLRVTVYEDILKRNNDCKIWGFHGGDYEEWCLLGCYAVWLL